MAKGFLQKLQEQQEAEALARLNKSLARDDILSRFDRGPVSELAMTVVGPTKFKSLLKLIPARVDKADNYADLVKFNKEFMKLPKNEQVELATLALPRLREGSRLAESTLRSDILNNPNASGKIASYLQNNQMSYNALGNKMEDVISGDYIPLKGGGVATLMPLKYEV